MVPIHNMIAEIAIGLHLSRNCMSVTQNRTAATVTSEEAEKRIRDAAGRMCVCGRRVSCPGVRIEKHCIRMRGAGAEQRGAQTGRQSYGYDGRRNVRKRTVRQGRGDRYRDMVPGCCWAAEKRLTQLLLDPHLQSSRSGTRQAAAAVVVSE